jgi:STE24 endopeptidase
MNSQLLFNFIVSFVIGEFILGRVLGFLNVSYYSNKLPVELSEIYSKEKYNKSQKLSKNVSR